jgi:dephospho-CoA kinase
LPKPSPRRKPKPSPRRTLSPSPTTKRRRPRPQVPRRLDVAITGGIGAGKSEALQAFARHGAATISSDDIVHDLIEEDEEVIDALLERFGTTKRSDIAEVVFADREQLAWLEALLHPRVVQRYLDWREQQSAQLAVTEVPLLYETGGDERFDRVVVITAPKALREARREPLPGDRETRLIDDKEKSKRADYAYVNTGSLEDLDGFVTSVVDDLTK